MSESENKAAFSRYDIDPTRGYLPVEDPLRRLSPDFDDWEEAAANLPKLLVSDRIRQFLAVLPPFPTDALQTEREIRRAMMILSYLGHAYVWGESNPADRLPAVLAVPWYEVAMRVGRLPVLSYASYALDNWRRLEPDGPVALGNIALLQNFLGGIDEEWFILIHVDIEAKAAAALATASDIQAGIATNDEPRVTRNLTALRPALAAMFASLERMPVHCDPYIYYHRVRPYIHGWKNNPALPDGLVYEGVESYGGEPQYFRGETGAQSSIIPAMDAVLGVTHQDDPLKTYLIEMRDYMPPGHRAFIEHIEAGPTAREFALATPAGSDFRSLYNDCVTLVARFRALHLEYAAAYIFNQGEPDAKTPTT